MKTAISVPEEVFRAADRLARHLGVSRSALYSRAVSDLVARHGDDTITSRLDEVYGPGGESSALDEGLATVQHRSLAYRKGR